MRGDMRWVLREAVYLRARQAPGPRSSPRAPAGSLPSALPPALAHGCMLLPPGERRLCNW